MSRTLNELLPEIEIQEPQQVEGFQVFGLRVSSGEGLPYATLDEAISADLLEVMEISPSGSVPQLKVNNRGDTMVFLMAGEELVGAKQNRILNVSIMIRARSEMQIPVSCVEAGRWAYRSKQFQSSGTTSHSLLRSQMAKQIMQSYKSTGRPMSDQSAVWGEVGRKLMSMGSRSASSELHQVYRDSENKLETICESIPVPEGCSGAVYAFGGRIVGADLFDKPATLSKLWHKLLRGYAIDALEAPEEKPSKSIDEVREWLDQARGSTVESFKSPGLGDDLRLEGKGFVGACLTVEDHPIHVEVLAEFEPGKQP